MKRWECTVCGFIYDEAKGLPEEGLAPGTRWEDIPDDWKCPDCGVSKAQFSMVERGAQDAIAEAQTTVAAIDEEMEKRPLVIVGSGMSGYTLAREYRKHDAEGRVILLSRDEAESYPKPQLSNALAKGKQPAELVQKSASEMAESLGIEVRTGVEVMAINPGTRTLRTSAGEVAYRDLVLAVGADQRRLKLEGDAANEILTVNDLRDYKAFRDKLPEKGRVVLLGGGLIGCEFANDLVASGCSVDVVDLADAPLSALIPQEAGKAVQEALAEQGVRWHLGCTARRVDRIGERLQCTLSNEETLEADCVLSATGLIPRTKLAAAAGLVVNRGIVTNAFLQTSDPHIYALGDCAEVDGRLEPYIATLRQGAEALAFTLSGSPTPVETAPMPVVVKTPACPVCVLPPNREVEGGWSVSGEEDGLECLYLSADGRLQGFALIGKAVARRRDLLGRYTSDQAPAVNMAAQ